MQNNTQSKGKRRVPDSTPSLPGEVEEDAPPDLTADLHAKRLRLSSPGSSSSDESGEPISTPSSARAASRNRKSRTPPVWSPVAPKLSNASGNKDTAMQDNPVIRYSPRRSLNSWSQRIIPGDDFERDYLRINGIPFNWTRDRLLAALGNVFSIYPNQALDVSLYPGCVGTDQVALLHLEGPQHNYMRTFSGPVLSINHQFYGLTPLNAPEGDIVAESVTSIALDYLMLTSSSVIALTSQTGNVFHPWKNDAIGRMWLKDFLPYNIKNIRIMSYGYPAPSSLPDSYSTDFIQQLVDCRHLITNKVCRGLSFGYCTNFGANTSMSRV